MAVPLPPGEGCGVPTHHPNPHPNPRSNPHRLAKEPDRDFVLSYVFGTLSSNMGGYHALTHLIKDQLVERPEPRTIMGAIASTGLQVT